ncbi:MAG TPA: vWA domain-containing protein, partial [Chthoniobacterales bacterium]
MPAIEEPPTIAPAPAPRRLRRWAFSPFLIVSVALHLLFAGGAAVWVVSRYSASRKLTFQAGPKSPNPSEQALQHRVQMEKKMSTQSLPAVPKRVLTTGLSKVELPPMPEMPAMKSSQNAPTMSAGGATGNFAATGAMSSGALGGTGSGAPINFFGIRDVSTSVVIMIDVSDSMFSRTGDAEGSKLVRLGKEQSFQAIRDEASKLVQSLTPATRFGIVRWAREAYPWKPELVAATEDNKRAAIAHIESEVDFGSARKGSRLTGTRHDYALEAAFKLKPETIYMLTDGNATGPSPFGADKISPEDIYRVADEGQKTLSKKARLHAIYYVTGEEKADERQMLTRLASRNDGRFLSVQAQGTKA